MKHDHRLEMAGIWGGIPVWEFVCDHSLDDERFDAGDHDDCPSIAWWLTDGLELVNASGRPDDDEDYKRWGSKHSLKLWTHWDEYNDSPLFLGYHEHTQWMEERE